MYSSTNGENNMINAIYHIKSYYLSQIFNSRHKHLYMEISNEAQELVN